MLFGFFLKFELISCDIVLDLRSLLVVNLIDICSACVIDPFIENPSPVKTNHSLLELLIAQVVLEKHLLNIILESLHRVILTIDF